MQEMKKKKAIIYARQSSGKDDLSESIEVQIANCERLAKDMKVEIIDIQKDLNSSGKLYPSGYDTLAKMDYAFQTWLKSVSTRKTSRAALGKVFKQLQNIDYIIVDDFTRLARPLNGSYLDAAITQELTANKVNVLTVKQGEIDLNSFSDGLVTTLQNRINDTQIAIQRKKSIDGLKKLKDSGVSRQGLSRVLGFKWTGKKHELEIVPREKEAVEFIYQAFLKGKLINDIVRDLNDKFADVWNKGMATRNAVYKALKRPFYAGYMYNSDGELIVCQQTTELAFISFSTWKKVNEILNTRKIANPRPKIQWNPFVGKIFCGKCGSRLRIRGGSGAGKKVYYGCIEHLQVKRQSCGCTITVSNDRKEGLGLVDAVKPLLVIGALKQLKEIQAKTDTKEKIHQLNIQLENLKNKEKKISQMWTKNLIDDTTYESTINDLAAEKKKLNIQITELTANQNSLDSEEETLKLMRKIVNGIITQNEYEDLLLRTVTRVEAFNDYVTIHTIEGKITLPKQQIWLYRLLPHYSFRSNGKKLYYYLGKKKEIANIYGNVEKIATLGELTVYLVR